MARRAPADLRAQGVRHPRLRPSGPGRGEAGVGRAHGPSGRHAVPAPVGRRPVPAAPGPPAAPQRHAAHRGHGLQQLRGLASAARYVRLLFVRPHRREIPPGESRRLVRLGPVGLPAGGLRAAAPGGDGRRRNRGHRPGQPLQLELRIPTRARRDQGDDGARNPPSGSVPLRQPDHRLPRELGRHGGMAGMGREARPRSRLLGRQQTGLRGVRRRTVSRARGPARPRHRRAAGARFAPGRPLGRGAASERDRLHGLQLVDHREGRAGGVRAREGRAAVARAHQARGDLLRLHVLPERERVRPVARSLRPQDAAGRERRADRLPAFAPELRRAPDRRRLRRHEAVRHAERRRHPDRQRGRHAHAQPDPAELLRLQADPDPRADRRGAAARRVRHDVPRRLAVLLRARDGRRLRFPRMREGRPRRARRDALLPRAPGRPPRRGGARRERARLPERAAGRRTTRPTAP